MVWFYHRDKVRLRLETRYDNERSVYLAVLIHFDGRREEHHFETSEKLRAWLIVQEQRLAEERWKQDGPPEVLLNGWPDKPPLV
jgi:hypothetical protein